eukprot:gene8708-11767_t
MALKIGTRLQSVEEQREFFMWKYRDIPRTELNELLSEFKKFDAGNKGELTEVEAMKLLEARGETKTATELRAMIADIDKDKNHCVSFLEWCVCIYHKNWEELNDFVDEEARARAMEEARLASEAAERAALEILHAAEEKERLAKERADKLEEESKLSGVAGMKAFFARQAEGASDVTKTNEQTIKEEAARRKVLRDAREKQNAAIQVATTQRRLSAVARDVQTLAQKRAEEEAAAIRKAAEDEKTARAARKAALNAKWGGGGPN